MSHSRNFVKLVVTVLCLLLAAESFAGEVLFESKQTLSISLTGPFKTIYRKRDKTVTYPGKLTYVNEQGGETSLNISIQVRGNFRLNKKNCDNPPLRILFDKKSVKGTIFEKQKELKLVVPCRNRSKFEQYVVLEYLEYQFFNVITDLSFRARLLEITFNNTERRSNVHVVPGFFIEDNKRLAKRINKPKFQAKKVWISELDPLQTARLNLFQYMVANTDFSTLQSVDDHCCHNVKLYKAEEDNLATPIPYDFDFTGLVDASYAVPNPGVKINSVRTRRYRGFCEQNDIVTQEIKHFLDKRREIEALVTRSQELTSDSKKKTLKYLKKFYNTIKSTKETKRRILKYCR